MFISIRVTTRRAARERPAPFAIVAPSWPKRAPRSSASVRTTWPATKSFATSSSLNFPLLADEEHKVAEKYGAWREKNMYGKVSMGMQRLTFLIDAEGVVRKAVEEGHRSTATTSKCWMHLKSWRSNSRPRTQSRAAYPQLSMMVKDRGLNETEGFRSFGRRGRLLGRDTGPAGLRFAGRNV